MSTSLSRQTSDAIRRYVAGEQPLSTLRNWIRTHALTVVEDVGDDDDEQLVYAVELLLSEREHGDWTEDELQVQLRQLLLGSSALQISG